MEKAKKNLNECYLSNGDKQKDLFETWFLMIFALTWAKFHDFCFPSKSTDSPASESTWTTEAPPPPRLDAVATRLASTVTPLQPENFGNRSMGVPNHFLSHWKPTPIYEMEYPIPSKLLADVPKFCHFLAYLFVLVLSSSFGCFKFQSVLGKARADEPP